MKAFVASHTVCWRLIQAYSLWAHSLSGESGAVSHLGQRL